MKNKTIAQMLIRQPAATVFDAFRDPAITTKFWFTKSSGLLEENKTVIWEWEMYGAKAAIEVLKIVPHHLITISWDNGKADFMFKSISSGTYVEIAYYNYPEDTPTASIADNVSGFTTVLDGAKAWLEHGLKLNLIADKFPPEAGK